MGRRKTSPLCAIIWRIHTPLMLYPELIKQIKEKFGIYARHDIDKFHVTLAAVVGQLFEHKIVENGIFETRAEEEKFFEVGIGMPEDMDPSEVERIKADPRFYIWIDFWDLEGFINTIHSEQQLVNWLSEFHNILLKNKIVKDMAEIGVYLAELDDEMLIEINENPEMRAEYERMYEGRGRKVQ